MFLIDTRTALFFQFLKSDLTIELQDLYMYMYMTVHVHVLSSYQPVYDTACAVQCD